MHPLSILLCSLDHLALPLLLFLGRLEGAYYHKDFHRNRKEIVKYIGMHRHSEAEMDTGSHDDAGRKRSSPDSQSTEGSAKRQHLLTTEESDSDSEVEFLYTVPSNGTVSTVAAPTAASNTCNPQHPFSNRNNINEEHDSKLPARPNAVNSAQNTNGPNAAKVPEPQNIRPNLHDAGTSTLHVASLNNNGTNMQAVRNVSSQPSPSSFDDSKLPAGRRNKSNNKQDEHDDECMGNNVQIRNEQDDSLRSNDENNDIAASSVQTPQKSSNSTVSVSPPYTSESSEESGKEDGPSCNSSFASSSDDFSRRQHQQGVTSQQHFSLNTTHSIQDKAFSNNTQSVLSAATTTVTTNCTSTQKVTSFRLKPLNSYPERSDRTSAITEKMNDESTGNTAFNLGTEETTTDTQPTSSEVTVTSSAVASTGADSSNNGNLGGANDIAQSRCLVGNALTKMAHEIVDEFQRDQRKQQSKLLASCLREKRNAVLEKARRHTSQRPMAANSPTFRDRIPAAGNIRPTAAFIQSIKEGLCVIESKDKKTVEMSRIKLEGIPPSLPRHNAPFMINSLCGGTEEEQLSYIPYLNESEGPQDVLSQAYHIDERQKRLERGAIYEENQKNLEIDTVLKGLLSRMGMTFCQLAEGSTSKAVTKACKDATDVSEKWVRERIDLIVTAKQTAPAKSETGAEIKRNNGLPASCDPRVEDKKYLKGIDTFRSLFCNRCSVYDCDVHGSNDEVPSLTLQYELSCARKRDGYWKVCRIFWFVTSAPMGLFVANYMPYNCSPRKLMAPSLSH